MKVLITPLIQNPNCDANYFITKNLASLFIQSNYACAISAPKQNIFDHGSVYACEAPAKPLLQHTVSNRSYEEYLYSLGALKESVLKEDIEHLTSLVDTYQPDVIITLDRVASLIVSKLKHVPCYAFVNQSIYTYTSFDIKALADLNKTLSSYHLEQVFNIKSLYDECDKRFAFGPIETQPLAEEWDIVRIGVASIYPKLKKQPTNIYIHFQDIDMSSHKLQKMIKDAFVGAKEMVNAYVKGQTTKSEANVSFLEKPKEISSTNAAVCIHDGNAYIFNQCLTLGIPQLIVASHGYLRNPEGLVTQRNRFGLCLYEDELTMASLYEVYRRILSDSAYKQHALEIQASTLQYGDLTKILYYL